MQANVSFSLEDLKARIAPSDERANGQAAIQDKPFTVSQILEFFMGGMSIDDIVAQYPSLEKEDVVAALYYARHLAN